MKNNDGKKIDFATVILWTSAVLMAVSILLLVVKNTFFHGKDSDMFQEPMTEVSCDFSKLNVGEVKSDTTLQFDYLLKNIGEDSLRVLFVSPDCNCTGYKLSHRCVGEGDSIALALYVDMKKHKGAFMLNTVVGLNTKQRLYRITIEGEIM